MKTIGINDFNNHKLEDSELIKRILSGEKELYEILVRRNNQKLYRVIRGYLNEEAEIQDVMQDSYIKAYIKLYQFRMESTFSTWLIRIAINESLRKLKNKGKLLHMYPMNKQNSDDRILRIPDDKRLNPQEKMIHNETKYLLEKAIDQLDIKYRTVYILREIEGMNIKEVAEALDLTVSNVKMRLSRSKAMLKEKLYDLSINKDVFEFGFSKCDKITWSVMREI